MKIEQVFTDATAGLIVGAIISFSTQFFKTAIRVNALSGAIAGATFYGIHNLLDQNFKKQDRILRFLGIGIAGAAALQAYAVSLSLEPTANWVICAAVGLIALQSLRNENF